MTSNEKTTFKYTRWGILLLGIIANLSMGISYSGSVIAKPVLLMAGVENDPGQIKTHWATVFTLGCVFLPFGMIIAGKLAEKWGPRLPIFIGAFVFGGGVFLSSFSKMYGYGFLCLTLGAMISIGSGLAYGPIVASAVRWFPDRRGLASGLVVGALGFGPVLIAPTCQWLLASQMWEINAVLQLLGCVSLFAILAASCITNPTPEYLATFVHKKQSDSPKKNNGNQKIQENVDASKPEPKKDYVWTEMIVTREFWTLFVLYMLGALPGLMLISQAKGIFETLGGFSPEKATALVAILSAANAFGRVLWGTISDYLGRGPTLLVMFFCSALAMFLLPPAATTPTLLFVVILVVGTTYGGYLGLFPSFCADAFGPKNMSMNYAILFIGFASAAIVGPKIYSVFQSPTYAFWMAAGLACLGFIGAAMRMFFNTKQLQR
ncbi:MAG: OFA family MFS transporter [Thermoguttaceae bacterium]